MHTKKEKTEIEIMREELLKAKLTKQQKDQIHHYVKIKPEKLHLEDEEDEPIEKKESKL